MTTKPLSPLLNEALVQRALSAFHRITENNFKVLKIKKFNFKLSSVSGENFCSDIYVVTVEYEWQGTEMENSFVVKLMLPEIADLTTNEQKMYTTVLPAMEAYLEANYGENGINKLHARCLECSTIDQEYYVMENLNMLGYFCADRIDGLDEIHAMVLMEKIAKFHATSMVYGKEHPNDINSLSKSHFQHGASDFVAKAITFGGLQYVSQMIEAWPGYEHLVVKIKNVMQNFNNMVMAVVKPENALFNVLNHGDLWVNNILYKYNSTDRKGPEDVVFVDFPTCFWGGCGYDLNWFFYTSLQLQVLKNKRLDLLKTYYNSLKLNLERLLYPSSDIPTWEEILLEFKRSEIIGFYTALCELPIVALVKDISKDFTLNTYADEEKMQKMRHAMYASERVKETIKYALKYFEESGFFN